MKKINPLISTPVRFGLFGGLISLLLFLILYFLQNNPLTIYRNFDFSFLLLPIFIFFSIREFRDYRNKRVLRFWQGMTVGFFNYLTIALISSLFLWIFLTIFDQQLLEGYIADRTQLILDKKEEMIDTLGADVYEKTYADLQETTASIIALDDFLKKIFIGLFLTIIISVILRRRPTQEI